GGGGATAYGSAAAAAAAAAPHAEPLARAASVQARGVRRRVAFAGAAGAPPPPPPPDDGDAPPEEDYYARLEANFAFLRSRLAQLLNYQTLVYRITFGFIFMVFVGMLAFLVLHETPHELHARKLLFGFIVAPLYGVCMVL